MKKLKVGDRVEITGPWRSDSDMGGTIFIGGRATVVKIDSAFSEGPYGIHIEDRPPSGTFYWCRKNLRLLPRKAK